MMTTTQYEPVSITLPSNKANSSLTVQSLLNRGISRQVATMYLCSLQWDIYSRQEAVAAEMYPTATASAAVTAALSAMHEEASGYISVAIDTYIAAPTRRHHGLT